MLAARHLETKFVRVHAEKAPFLTGRWLGWAGVGGRCGRWCACALCAPPGTLRCPDLTTAPLRPCRAAQPVCRLCRCRGAHHVAPKCTAAFAERLKIWMLPTVAVIKNEKTTDYIVGLDELGGVEDFSTGRRRRAGGQLEPGAPACGGACAAAGAACGQAWRRHAAPLRLAPLNPPSPRFHPLMQRRFRRAWRRRGPSLRMRCRRRAQLQTRRRRARCGRAVSGAPTATKILILTELLNADPWPCSLTALQPH